MSVMLTTLHVKTLAHVQILRAHSPVTAVEQDILDRNVKQVSETSVKTI